MVFFSWFIKKGWQSLLNFSPSRSPKMDFWGIRLPRKKQSTPRQAFLSGILIGFRDRIWWGDCQIEDMNGDSSVLPFDFNNTHLVQ